MRRGSLAAGAACAVLLTAPVGAQLPSTTAPVNSAMPGLVVSNFNGNSFGTAAPTVGRQFPAAAPQAGQQIGTNPLLRPVDPNRPYDIFKGTNIDVRNVAAPLVGPDGKQYQPPDALDRLSQKIKDFFRLNPPPPRPNYTPGIVRRKKERIEERMWRRD